MRLATFGLFIQFLFLSLAPTLATEIDSVRTKVTPVQCYGLRNGAIRVDAVFGGTSPYFYSIDGQSFTTNPSFDHLWAGEYTLYVRDATGESKNCPFTVKEPAELLVRLLASDTVVVAGTPLDIRAIASVETEFLQQIEWLPSALFARQDTLRQTLSISEATPFAVTVRDKNGCAASDHLTVEVERANLYFPNVIKPGSAADGYFTVFAGDGLRRVVSLQVFSRGGALVFERFDFQPNAPLQGWGGRWNGKVAQAGVYSWLAVVEFLDGKQARYEGAVTVVN